MRKRKREQKSSGCSEQNFDGLQGLEEFRPDAEWRSPSPWALVNDADEICNYPTRDTNVHGV